jgi:pyruvate formate-lyase/glycerol dehydratase family glycyl radical enzyme
MNADNISVMRQPTSTSLKPHFSDCILSLKRDVQVFSPGICTERALIWTGYFKNRENRSKPVSIQIAEALREVLLRKTIRIYPGELIVGNFTSKRVGGQIEPELLGVPVMQDIFRFARRKTNPLQISALETWQLLRILPFWLTRFLAIRAHKSPLKKIRNLISQLRSHYYVMNEAGGVAHTIPDHEKLIRMGTDGIISEISSHQQRVEMHSEQWHFYEAMKISAEAFSLFSGRYGKLAGDMADQAKDSETRRGLKDIAECFKIVPRKGASTFREALQTVYLAHIAIMMESLDNSIGLGRMDQYLYPYYERDVQRGILTREQARDLIAAFNIKLCELVPVFPEKVINFHGGFYNAQVVTVGGLDRDGNDATNELTYIFLDVMNGLRMREPNYHGRMHAGSPEAYVERIVDNLCEGSNTPALYNDDEIIASMLNDGFSLEDARDYSGCGCVEPIAPGKSFASTNAAMVNFPIILELALNRGRRFNSPIRSGAATMAASRMKTMADLKQAFETQLRFIISRLMDDLHALEKANRDYHPTPFTSMLHEGCIASGKCATAGGAMYNFSGIQAVAPVGVGDALYAIDKMVFEEGKISLPDLVSLLKKNINDPKWLAILRGLKKFGNDEEDVDQWTIYAVDAFGKSLEGFVNTRGGRYRMGIYSDTLHEFYGRINGASAYGRRKGECFSSGLAPANGFDRKGPTALINSLNRFDFKKIPNGINFNLKFYPQTLKGDKGRMILSVLLKTYFQRGGIQVQINVLDPEELKKARDNPLLYPNLMVRVSGYTVYFNDLSQAMKDEIIQRSSLFV